MIEKRIIECPFCGKQTIGVLYIPSMLVESKQSFGRSHTKSIRKRTEESYEVQNDCSECGAKLKDIQKRLNNPSERPSREKILERMKAAGLATRI